MSNPHFERAQNGSSTPLKQVEATLALAYEAMTANLLALSEIQGESVNGRATLAQIETRLGLGETK